MTTFLERAVRIAAALNQSGLWDEADGFFYDLLRMPDGSAVPLRIHSMVGLLPILPAVTVPRSGDRARGRARQALRARSWRDRA